MSALIAALHQQLQIKLTENVVLIVTQIRRQYYILVSPVISLGNFFLLETRVEIDLGVVVCKQDILSGSPGFLTRVRNICK